MHCAWCWLVAEMGVGFRAKRNAKILRLKLCAAEDSARRDIITTTTRSSISCVIRPVNPRSGGSMLVL